MKCFLALSLLALAHAKSTREAFDEWWGRLDSMTTPGAFDTIISSIVPDAKIVVTTGPETNTLSFREYFEGYRTSVAELESINFVAQVLEVSGPTVTGTGVVTGVFKNGCEWATHCFMSYDFNEKGEAVHAVQQNLGLDSYMACFKGEKAPVTSLVPSSKMPKGYEEYNDVINHLTDEGALDKMLSMITPEGKVELTMGAKTEALGLREYFEGYRTAIKELSVWRSEWLPLVQSEHSVSVAWANFGVFKDGCVTAFKGYANMVYTEEGKISYMYSHVPDMSSFDKCAAQQKPEQQRLAATPSAFNGGTSIALVAFIGAAAGVVLSAAAVAALLGTWPRFPKLGAVPLLQDA